MESGVRGIYKDLTDAINDYNRACTAADTLRALRLVRQYTLDLGIHRELRIDSTSRFSPDDVMRIETFAEELANEKITGALYVMGQPYSGEHIRSTVEAMTVDPLAYSLRRLRGGDLRDWRRKAVELVRSGAAADDAALCRLTGLSAAALDSARSIRLSIEGSRDMLSRMMVMGAMMPPEPRKPLRISERVPSKGHHGMLPGMSAEKALEMARKMGADDEAIEKMKAAMRRKDVTAGAAAMAGHPGKDKPSLTEEQMAFATAVGEVERALGNVARYRDALLQSPAAELSSIVNALDGGFIAPTSGGDPVLNPAILPTGRNMFAVNAEETPSAVAWEKGKDLAEGTIAMYRKAHGDSIPRKVSYTLEQRIHRDRGRHYSADTVYARRGAGARSFRACHRPEAHPVRGVGTSAHRCGGADLRAASRPGRIAPVPHKQGREDGRCRRCRHVSQLCGGSVVESERYLVDKGVSPREARELSASRVFGGVNGNYGSGIQGMVEAGDRWNDASEIADTYIANMGAGYGSEETWEQMRDYALRGCPDTHRCRGAAAAEQHMGRIEPRPCL